MSEPGQDARKRPAPRAEAEAMAGAGKTRLGAVLLLTATFAFATAELRALQANTDPEAYDTSVYLGEANGPLVRAGPLAFAASLFSGEWAQRNQHPLYVLALAPVAGRDLGFVKRAQLVSAALGILAALGVFALGWRVGGPLVAATPVLALALTPQLTRWSALVGCEMLLILACIASFHLLRPALAPAFGACLGAGGCIGLAYLTKGTGLFLLPGLAAALPFVRGRGRAARGALGLLFAFLLVASPLLVRNALRYGNPIHNVNTTKLQYSERALAEEAFTLFDPQSGQAQKVYPAAPRPESDGGLVARLAGRVVAGLPAQSAVLLQTLCVVPANRLPAPARVLFALTVLALAGIGLAREPSRAVRVYFLATGATFIVALALFNPIARYLFPLLPVVWIYATRGVGAILTLPHVESCVPAGLLRNAEAKLGLAAAAGALGLGLGNLGSLEPGPLLGEIEDEPARREIVAWLRENLAAGERYAEGPFLNWQLERGTHVLGPTAVRQELSRFNAFAERAQVEYLVLDWTSLTRSRYRGGGVDRQALLAPHVHVDRDAGLVFRSALPGWRMHVRDPGTPSRFALLRRARPQASQTGHEDRARGPVPRARTQSVRQASLGAVPPATAAEGP